MCKTQKYYAYIASSDSGLRVLDVSNPASPREVSQLDTLGRAILVLVSDTLMYLLEINLVDSSFLYTIQVIDVSEPDNPRIVDSVEVMTGLPAYLSLVEADDHIYFLNLDTMLVIDVYGSNGNK